MSNPFHVPLSNNMIGCNSLSGLPLSQGDSHRPNPWQAGLAAGLQSPQPSKVSFTMDCGDIPGLDRENSNPYRAPSQPSSQPSSQNQTAGGPPTTNAKFFPKTIHDRVHDQMTLHPLLVEIMDTVVFQRLRGLHQLGPCRLLFPGATHTRFEHSLGVAHLAMRMAKQIKENHETVGPALDINAADILCLGVAGLCHDLGHGPYSHLFEVYVNSVNEEKCKATGERFVRWHHESASISLLKYLMEENQIDVTKYGLVQEDVNFIMLLISGIRSTTEWPDDIGRDESKRYLFDIVANKRNGIDVDKLDYFLRDSLSCYGKLPEVNLDRIFVCARVIVVEGQSQVCYQEKIALSLGELFTLRAKMHKYVYQHRITKSIEEMVMDAMRLSEGHFQIEVADPQDKAKTIKLSLSECPFNMEAYSKIGDWVIDSIFLSGCPELAPARALIRRIKERKLYELVGHYALMNKEQPRGAMAHLLRQSTGLSDTPVITAGDIARIHCGDEPSAQADRDHLVANLFITKARITYGSSGDKPGDPVNHVRFFNPKQNPNVGFPLNAKRVSNLFSPTEFVETTVFLFTKDNSNGIDVFNAFQMWKSTALPRDHAEPIACINSSPSSAFKQENRKRNRDDDPPPGFHLGDDEHEHD